MSTVLDPTGSATLHASAGTGKTWTLTARIVRLLLAGATPGGILALTFTRKAAAEMRSRVASRLQTLAFADDASLVAELTAIGSASDAETCARARGLFEAFLHAEVPLAASTLHVFCAGLLRRFALEAEVPAGFALVEQERPWRTEAIATVLSRAHRDPQGPLATALDTLAAEGMSEHDVHSLLHSAFDHRAELWAASDGEPDVLAALCEALAQALPWQGDEDIHAATEAPAVLARLKMLFSLLHDLGNVGKLQWRHLEPALDSRGAARLAHLQAVLFTDEGKRRSFKPAASRFTPAQTETLVGHFEAVCAAVEQASEVSRRAATFRRSQAALTLALAALEAFAERLARSHQLGFPELEWETVRLLRRQGRAEWVRYKLDARLEHILLDEFQDTSPTQWQLLRPLIEEFATPGVRQRTVFLVGDGKQSIYGFRRAEPELLPLASRQLAGWLGAGQGTLDESRRSAPAVITFVNALFAGEAGQAIGFAPHRTALASLHGAVEVTPLTQGRPPPRMAANDALRNPLDTPREEAEDRRASEEAEGVVTRIRALLAEGTPVTERGGVSRPMHAGDILILARQRTHLAAIEKALAAAGLPYSSATRGTLLQTALARDLLALLAAIDSPHRDLELASALRSPLFSVSDEELFALSTAAHAAGVSLATALAAPQTALRLQRAQQLLQRWRAAAHTLPPHDLLDHIVSEGDLLRRVQAARAQDTQAAANLSALLQLALDSDHGRYPTLSRFLRDCEELAAGQGPDESPPPTGEARIRVMTVHAAKGLEAPAVFIVNAAPVPRAAQAGWRVDWPASAARPRVILYAGNKAERDRTSAALIDAASAREEREALNLLYVAVTRAQQYLFISGFQSGTKLQADSWHARCRAAVQTLTAMPAETNGVMRFASGAAPTVLQAGIAAPMPTALDPRLLKPLREAPAAAISDAARDPLAALRGEIIHATLQHLSDGLSDEIALRGVVERQLGQPVPESLWQASLGEARAVLTAPALSRFFGSPLRAWNELPLLTAETDGAAMHIIDRLVDTGDALWVLDYKTHRAPDAASVLEGARSQLARYIAAIQRLHPARAVHAAVVWTPHAQLLPLE